MSEHARYEFRLLLRDLRRRADTAEQQHLPLTMTPDEVRTACDGLEDLLDRVGDMYLSVR